MNEDNASKDKRGVGAPASDAGRGGMAPGDEAPWGTPGTGENTCPHCGGSGKMQDGNACDKCDGTGKVNVGIGGA